MRKLFLPLLALLMVGLSSQANAQITARVQVIHNSADLAADTVDVWLNNTLLFDDFAFREASPFVDAPAGIPFDVSIQPKTSSDTVGALYKNTYTLTAGETYVIVAAGIVSPTGYAPATPFDLYVSAVGREAASTPGNTDVLVFHGATDAPTVDVVEVSVPAGTVVDNASFGDFTADYLELPTADYSLQIRTDGMPVVAQYAAGLSTLGLTDSAVIVLASGFLDPSSNSGGPAFGLYAALPSGGNLVPLSSETFNTASVQAIHNCADLAADTVDIWLDNILLADNFAFRTASSFLEVPAGVDFDLTVLPKTSSDTIGKLFTKTFNLMSGESYAVIASGIVSPSGYTPAQPFDLVAFAGARSTSTTPGNTDVLVYHGSTDAPSVQVVEVGVGAGQLFTDFMYTDFEGYLDLANLDYSLQVRTLDNTTVAQYGAPLSTLGLADAAVIVVASGFLSPADNSGGPAFGLWAAVPAGGNLVELPTEAISTARLKVIHASADMAADTVDVWLDNTLLLDDFPFLESTDFIDAPAGTPFDVIIQPKTSTDTVGAVFRKTFTLTGGEKYIVTANGIVSPSGYSPAVPFDLTATNGALESSNTGGNTSLLLFHGSTDAPTVDVLETTIPAGTLSDNLAYGTYDGYLDLAVLDYEIDIMDSTASTTVRSYSVPLSTLGTADEALIAVAAGFLDPSVNSMGQDFGIWVAYPEGGSLVPLPLITSVEEESLIEELAVYPNPSNGLLNIEFSTVNGGSVAVNMYDLNGGLTKHTYLGETLGNFKGSVVLSDLPSGIYFAEIISGNGRAVRKVVLSK